jgi:transglutaminase-like putative cysteine protease
MKLRTIFFISVLACSALITVLFGTDIAYSQSNETKPAAATEQPNGIPVVCNISYTISAPGNTRRIRLVTLTPESVPDIQKIERVEYSLKPIASYRVNGYRYNEFMIYNPARIEKLEVTINAELYRYDLQTAMENKEKEKGLLSILRVNTDENERPKGLEEFLKQEKYIEKDDTRIREIAKSITGASEVDIVKNIYDYVLDNMEYVVQGRRDLGALNALRHKKGDCSEYSDLFAAICRAKNIPARVVNGFSVQPDTKTAKHNWVEVYFTKYGWVPFDPSKGDVNIRALRERLFKVLEPTYIYFSHLRNDYVLQGYHYCAFTYFGDQAIVTDSVKFEFPKQTN